MKVWDVTISGYEETKYHKGILLGDFEEFITQLKAGAFSDKGIKMGFVKFVDALVKDVSVLTDESGGKNE